MLLLHWDRLSQICGYEALILPLTWTCHVWNWEPSLSWLSTCGLYVGGCGFCSFLRQQAGTDACIICSKLQYTVTLGASPMLVSESDKVAGVIEIHHLLVVSWCMFYKNYHISIYEHHFNRHYCCYGGKHPENEHNFSNVAVSLPHCILLVPALLRAEVELICWTRGVFYLPLSGVKEVNEVWAMAPEMSKSA